MGLDAVGLKPIESGVSPGQLGDDAARLLEASRSPISGRRLREFAPQPFAFTRPVSPHLAAREAGVEVDVLAAARWVDRHPAEVQVIETAGALLSPLSDHAVNLDLVTALDPDALVLVAPDRLGVLHEVRSTLVAQRALAPHLREPVVLLQPPAVADASTGTNARELERLGVARGVVTFPRCKPELADAAAVRVLRACGIRDRRFT
jgi:dethiobiotin synthetase